MTGRRSHGRLSALNGVVHQGTAQAGAPVGCTSGRAEVTASGAGRLCDEQSFERSAALGCIKGPSEAGKTEIPVYTVRSERLLMEELNYNLLFRWFVGLNMDDPANIPHTGPFMPATTEM